jgi:hypothetical protein
MDKQNPKQTVIHAKKSDDDRMSLSKTQNDCRKSSLTHSDRTSPPKANYPQPSGFFLASIATSRDRAYLTHNEKSNIGGDRHNPAKAYIKY